jgi:hypothetical protein
MTSTSSSPDKAEIKISLDHTMIERARTAFGLGDAAAELADIWFCDHVVQDDGDVRLDLAENDLIVRLRRRGEDSDSTIKFRCLGEIVLPEDWKTDDPPNKSKFEGDWTGTKHQLSASVTANVSEALFGTLPSLSGDWFTGAQQGFAAWAAKDLDEPLVSLTPLGPIYSLHWELDEDATGFGDKIVFEQWSVDDLGFLELSVRVDFDDAAAWQDRFTGFVRDKGFDVRAHQETKTTVMLRHLANRGDR